jgi:hypothetical protein
MCVADAEHASHGSRESTPSHIRRLVTLSPSAVIPVPRVQHDYGAAMHAAACEACSGASRARSSWSLVAWVRRGIPAEPSPRPNRPPALGRSESKFAQWQKSPAAGATETSGGQAFLFLPGSPHRRYFVSFLPPAVSIHLSPFPLQPHSTLPSTGDCHVRFPPNWPLVLQPLLSRLVLFTRHLDSRTHFVIRDCKSVL